MDSRTATLLLNTLFLSGATCVVSLSLGTVLAWLLIRSDLPGRRFVVAMLGVLLFVPLYLQTAAWEAGFGLQGCYTLAFSLPLWLQGMPGAVWIHSLAAVPWVVLFVGVGLRQIEPELEEQALLNARAGVVFRRVTLRGNLVSLGIAALWIFMITAGDMTVTDRLQVRTYAEELYTSFALGEPPSFLLGLLLTGVLVVAGFLVCAKLVPRQRPTSSRSRLIFRLGKGRTIAAWLFVVLVLLLLVGVPLTNLLYKAGYFVLKTEDGWSRGFSIGKCLEMIASSPWRYRREFGWSFGIAALSASLALFLGIGLAWLARRGGLRALPALFATSLCLAIPGPVVGLGLIQLLNRSWGPFPWLYDQTILTPCLALTFRALVPTILISWHAFRTIPEPMFEAALLDGASSFTRLWQIAIPLRWPAIALGWLVAFAVALADLATSILVVPPGVNLLSIRIFSLLHGGGVDDRTAGICLALVLWFALLAGLAWLIHERSAAESY